MILKVKPLAINNVLELKDCAYNIIIWMLSRWALKICIYHNVHVAHATKVRRMEGADIDNGNQLLRKLRNDKFTTPKNRERQLSTNIVVWLIPKFDCTVPSACDHF